MARLMEKMGVKHEFPESWLRHALFQVGLLSSQELFQMQLFQCKGSRKSALSNTGYHQIENARGKGELLWRISVYINK
jgi:hypothetical protein